MLDNLYFWSILLYIKNNQGGFIMTSKKAKAFTLGTLLFFAASCKHNENHDKQPNTDRADFNKEIIERDIFISDYIDSALTAQGVYPVKDMEFYPLRDSLNAINFENSASGALTKAVHSAGEKIVGRYVNKLCKKLDSYDLFYDRNEIKQELLQDDFIMCDLFDDIYSDANKKKCVQAISESMGLDRMEYSDEYKNEIQTAMDVIITNMCTDLQNSRKSVEKQYAKYFAGGMKLIEEAFNVTGGYDLLEYEFDEFQEIPCWTTFSEINVYAPKLSQSFFDDTTAQYSLKSLGNARWCVVKRMPNGKVIKSEPFVDSATYNTYGYPACPYMNSELRFDENYNDTIGGMVCYKKVVRVEKPLVDYPKSKALSNQSKALQKRYDRLYEQKQKYNAQRSEAYNQAVHKWNALHNKSNVR